MRRFGKMIFLGLCFLLFASISYGRDTDLYVVSGVDIPPNVLIILDSSASMDEVVSEQVYDPGIDYSLYGPPTVYPQYAVYNKTTGNKWNLWADDVRTISCTDLRDNYLMIFGLATNYSNTSCGISKTDFQTGNYRNFLQLTGGPGGSRPRFGLASGIIHSYINTTNGVRFAVMVFNRDKNGNTVRYNQTNQTEYVFGDSRDNALDADGGQLLGFVDENKNGKTDLFNALSGFKNDSWSPLAETLYEAMVYFKGETSAITGIKYTSPVQYYCQKNYVLIISDGIPTKDSHSALSSMIGDQDKDGKVEMDDVALSLRSIDLSGGKSAQKQNITTYTIGFSVTQKLLEDTAKYGGGKYFYVWSSQSFSIAFQTFIAEVLEKSTSYVAPVVPISQMEKTTAGNRLYLAMFKPTAKSFWKGNIKKYGIATENTNSIKVGDILDTNGSLVMDSQNMIKKSAWSYWSSEADGGEVESGGAGEKLLKRNTARNIYTYLGTSATLSDSSNSFSLSNSAITPQKLGLASGDTTGREKVINFVHGLDSYDENGNGNLTEKRGWILGAFIHSRPLIIHYGTTRSVVYAGANDGMLHAFADDSGEELWAFIPPSLLSSLSQLNGEALQFFVDGSPKAHITDSKIVLIFGLRRGGNQYIALDITDPDSPKYLWDISPSRTGYGELGQAWSTPQLGKVKIGSDDKWVAFIGGGYDENQDSLPAGSDTKGRAIYAIDVLTGNLIWSYSYAKNSSMTYCIPSDIARVDIDGNGKVDRLYVGDIGGRMWRFDIGDPNTTKWTGKIIFNSNSGSSDYRKIFYPPDVTLEKDGGNYEMVFFGTGDREHPKATNYVNRLYAVKDKNPSSPLSETDLVDVTLDLLQDPGTSDADKTTILNSLRGKNGWYIMLDQNLGEKCLSNPVVFYGTVYYTTFTPSPGSETDVCFVGEGTGRIYALNYKTGNAAFNLDGVISPETITRGDRSATIGTSIPSGTIITFIGGTAAGYVGIGGGVYIPLLQNTKSLVPVNWRVVF